MSSEPSRFILSFAGRDSEATRSLLPPASLVPINVCPGLSINVAADNGCLSLAQRFAKPLVRLGLANSRAIETTSLVSKRDRGPTQRHAHSLRWTTKRGAVRGFRLEQPLRSTRFGAMSEWRPNACRDGYRPG